MNKFKIIYKNGQKNIKFHNTEIEEYKFYQHKNSILINNIDINKVVVFNKQKLEKYEYVVSNNETENYPDEENSDNYDEENVEKN